MVRHFCEGTERQTLMETLVAVEDTCQDAFGAKRKGIHANVEFHKGAAYLVLGIRERYLTSLFTCSRVFGWISHFHELNEEPRLIPARFSPTVEGGVVAGCRRSRWLSESSGPPGMLSVCASRQPPWRRNCRLRLRQAPRLSTRSGHTVDTLPIPLNIHRASSTTGRAAFAEPLPGCPPRVPGGPSA